MAYIKIITKWWNLLYYFYQKFHIKGGELLGAPIFLFFNSKVGRKIYYAINKREFDPYIYWKDAIDALMPDMYAEMVLFILIGNPLISLGFIINALCNKYFDTEPNLLLIITIVGVMLLIANKLNKYLLGNKARQKRYFKSFDVFFAGNTLKKYLYACIALITGITLFGLIVLGLFMIEYIK